MPKFAYSAIDASGAEIEGTTKADTVGNARTMLVEQNLFPIRIEESRGILDFELTKEKVKTKNLMNFTRQLAVFVKAGIPITWNKVHNTPHYTHFNHSIHVAKGVGCQTCHGQIDDMNLVFQSKTLLMEWCLECHRQPERYLRPKSEVFNMRFKPEDGTTDTDGEVIGPNRHQADLGLFLKEKYQVREASVLTNCSICHR